MWKPSTNPAVLELNKTHRLRQYRLGDLKPIRTATGKACVWCLIPLTGNKHKWCSEECVSYALAWARPQTGHGLAVLLERQGNACALCQLSWQGDVDTAWSKQLRWPGRDLPNIIERHMRWLMRITPPSTRPEVDHIVGVAIGGQTLGFDNVQAICRPCHKAKSKIDGKTRMALKGNKNLGKPKSKAHKAAMSESRKGFDSEARKAHRLEIYVDNKIPLIATNTKTGEERHFGSLQEAATLLGLQESNISRVVRGDQNRKQHKGWKFRKS